MNPTRTADDHEALRRLLLAALGRARRPLTTAELRERVNAATPTPAHHEAVYRNLIVLENRRRVARRELDGRNVTWVLQVPRPPLSARVPRRHPLLAGRAAATETTRRGGTSPTKTTQKVR